MDFQLGQYYFTFELNYNLRGLWGGVTVASTIIGVWYIYLVYSADLEYLAKEISEKIQNKHEDMKHERISDDKLGESLNSNLD